METAFQMLRRAMLRIVGLPNPSSLPRRITQPFAITRLASSAPTAEVVRSWSADQVQAFCRDELELDAGALEMLKDNRVIGRTLLGIKESDLGGLGMKLGDAITLIDFVNTMRFGGPKTIRINLLGDAGKDGESNVVMYTFETQAELREFIRIQGSAGLRNGDDKSIGKLLELIEGGLYTLDFATGTRAIMKHG